MQRRDFLTTTVGLIGSGLAVQATAITIPNRKIWAGRDLSGLALKNQDLAGADLRGCRMEGTDFTRADLRGARLDHTDIKDAKFDGARMAGASLEGAAITSTSFRYADLTGGTFGGATITDSWFEHADLARARFRVACFEDLIGFDHAVLDSADFRDSTLSGMMMFENCRMHGALFAGMKCLPWIESPASTLLFDGADAQRIDLTGITANISCEGADFREAILVGASLDFHLMDERGQPESRARRIESFINDAIFQGAVLGNTRINGTLIG